MTDTKHNHLKLSPEESPKVKEAKPERLRRPQKRPKKEQKLKQIGRTAPEEELKIPTPDSKQKTERTEIPQEIIDELRDMSKERRIKKEIFFEFLKEKDLLERKKEVVSRLAAYDIKIMRKKNILKPERLKIYNDFLTQYKKELRAIVRRAKKNFGLVESTYIYNLFDNETEFKKNLKLLKHYLKENEIKIIKIPRAKMVKANLEKSEIVGDPVRQY
ncbi:MAG: hypothetical protein JSV88_19260, partial [Candidatus Aminicenantes bacterium]